MNDSKELKDTQAELDTRGITIQKVGIRELTAPVTIDNQDGSIQNTIATFSLYGSLSADVKGTNMSRFSRVIHTAITKNSIGVDFMRDILKVMRETLGCLDVYVKISFPFYELKHAPISGIPSYVKRDVIFEGEYVDTIEDLYLTVEANYTSLCPCSKNMSLLDDESFFGLHDSKLEVGLGAHNQKSKASIKVLLLEESDRDTTLWIEDLASIIEESGSCPIWNALKREDEKYVTERAYNNPKFVEDVTRDIALQVAQFNTPFVIVAEHFESIHQSTAVAVIKGGLE